MLLRYSSTRHERALNVRSEILRVSSSSCRPSPNRISRSFRKHLPQQVAAEPTEKPYDPSLIQATNQYIKGVDDGDAKEDVVAEILGAIDKDSLTPVQDLYKEKVQAKLEEKAKEIADQKLEGQDAFLRGQAFYERGQYASSEQELQSALKTAGEFSQLGGEIQMWLALALSANGKEAECISMYKRVAESHPNPKIRRQAKDLCFIMEAPKLERSVDERVNIPVMELDPNMGGKKKNPGFKRKSAIKSAPKIPKTMEEEFWDNYRPPSYLRNKYVWVAAAAIGIFLSVYSSRLS